MRIVAALVMCLIVVGCGSPPPSTAPDQFIHVINESNRAVMVATGLLLDTKGATAARPCGGEVSLQVDPSSYEDDGRLLAFIGVDLSGAFDVSLKAFAGDPIEMPGNFSAVPIWSDGTLTGRLPLYLTVAADLTVTETDPSSPRSSAACVPAY